MAKKNVSPDLPQPLLNEFNRVDFAKIGFSKSLVMSVLKSYASGLPKKNPNKQYKSNGVAKIITADFEQDLLDLLNQYDWELVPPQALQNMIQQLHGVIGNMIPAKKGK